MTRLLCCGDLHLGAGSEYGRKPGDRLRDQQQVWERILDLARERDVDGILFAGDAFEGPTPTSEHYDAFLRPLRERWTDAEGPLPFLAISGNGRHDSAMRATNALQVFDGSGITVAATPDIYSFAGCAVATLPWVSPARLVAARGGGDRDELHTDVAAMLIDIARGLKEDCARVSPGWPHVLLAHWSVSGSSLPNGLPVDQLREPVLPVSDLDAIGFDHIVLGHIHRGQEVGARGFYVGSPMPLSFGEASIRDSHGVWILHTDERDIIDAYAAEFVPVSSRPLVTLDADITGDTETSGLAYVDLGLAWNDQMQDGAIVRARIRATADQWKRVDVVAVKDGLHSSGAAMVKLVPEIVRQDRARVTGLDEQVGELDALERWMVAEGIVGVDEPWELAAPTGVLADAMRARLAGYLERV